MKTLHVTVANRAATYSRREGDIVCGNNDYEIKFLFDAEWDGITEKTAHFKWNGQHFDVDFTGDTCPVPIITNAHLVKVGIFVDGVRATTDATIGCIPSTLCGSTTPNPGTGQNYTNEAKAAAEEAKAAADEAETSAEEAKAAAEAGKAIIVTVDGTTPSHTSQEIQAAMSEGKLVYRHLWGSTYIPCMRSSPTEAYFVSSTPTTPAVVDGVQYPMASIGIWAIKGNKTETVTVPVANRGYVDTLFGKAMECVGSVTFVPETRYDDDLGKDVYYLGSAVSTGDGVFYDNDGSNPIFGLSDANIVMIDIVGDGPEKTNSRTSTICGVSDADTDPLGIRWGVRIYLYSSSVFDIPVDIFNAIFKHEYFTCSSVTFTGYKLPTA